MKYKLTLKDYDNEITVDIDDHVVEHLDEHGNSFLDSFKALVELLKAKNIKKDGE